MELKKYQIQVLRQVKDFLKALAAERAGGNPKYAAQEAWETLREQGADLKAYHAAKTGNGLDMPSFCVKVPTGGGKTLLATQILGQAYRTLLPERNGAGLVLWVVPTDQIYQDTLKALRDRSHFYRESLEFAVSRRIQVWEKHEIHRLTPGQLTSDLNILLIKLPGTNRQDKETLKFFRDTGGNIVRHFPHEDDYKAQKALLSQVKNLDMLVADETNGQFVARTSLANLVRLCQPVVILDEKQRAASELARETIQGFNPILVVELSATPPDKTNVLCNVTGQDLLAEEMIKLPINVATSGQKSWQMCLSQAFNKRKELEARAREHSLSGKPAIRPIVLVQVERVGKNQRDTQYVHSEDVREFLVQNMGIDSQSVRVKTGETNEIEDEDLLAEDCPVKWIITKAALQEGWDCSYAYILVSLANMNSKMSMTQLVGRVLRQPFAEKTPFPELNESYIYCLHRHSSEVVREIRKALTQAGYEGDGASVVDIARSEGAPTADFVNIRPQFANTYVGPIAGTILLPRFCVRTDDQYEPLDYYQHLLSEVNAQEFDYAALLGWDLSADLKKARDQFLRIDLRDDEDVLEINHIRDERILYVESDEQTCAWLAANIDMDWYSVKCRRRIVERVCRQLAAQQPDLQGRLALVRFPLLERITALIERETDCQTEKAFDRLEAHQRLGFTPNPLKCVFELPKRLAKKHGPPLKRSNYENLERSLYDRVCENEGNQMEMNFAQELDEDSDILWWHRNAVGQFRIQGWRRSPIYPDFVMQMGRDNKAYPRTLMVETKGDHLEGNTDTLYKRQVADRFNRIGCVNWHELTDGTTEHDFQCFVLSQGETWRDEWQRMKEQGYGYTPRVANLIMMK